MSLHSSLEQLYNSCMTVVNPPHSAYVSRFISKAVAIKDHLNLVPQLYFYLFIYSFIFVGDCQLKLWACLMYRVYVFLWIINIHYNISLGPLVDFCKVF